LIISDNAAAQLAFKINPLRFHAPLSPRYPLLIKCR
jgi:hypothetical protein